jgi:chemotaxis protein methyltransferase CheR
LTSSAGNSLNLPLGSFLLLRDLLQERLGVWFEEDKRDLLAVKLGDRVVELGLRSFLDYYYRLKYGAGAEAEWPHVTELLSVQETFFWREFDQVRVLVERLIPEHVAARRGPIRIWSAACATGEEPLTLAMALRESGWHGRADIEIWASDVSTGALAKAQRGVYRERSFRALPPALREKYFLRVEDGWRIDPAVADGIRYARVNLLEPRETALLATAPYIFCRNVFIYFSQGTIERVAANFAARMPRPGYLFVGAAESLLRVKSEFELTELDGTFFYVKS